GVESVGPLSFFGVSAGASTLWVVTSAARAASSSFMAFISPLNTRADCPMLLARAGSFAAPKSRRITARMIRRWGQPNAPPSMGTPRFCAIRLSLTRGALSVREDGAVACESRRCPFSRGVTRLARLDYLDGAGPSRGEALERARVADLQRRDRPAALVRRSDVGVVEILAEERRHRVVEGDARRDVAAGPGEQRH